MEGRLELTAPVLGASLKGWRRIFGKGCLTHSRRWWKMGRCGLCGLRCEGLKQPPSDLTARNSCSFNLPRIWKHDRSCWLSHESLNEPLNVDHDLTYCSQLACGGKCKLAFCTLNCDGWMCALFSIIEMTENHAGCKKNILNVTKLFKRAQKHRTRLFLSQAELGKR